MSFDEFEAMAVELERCLGKSAYTPLLPPGSQGAMPILIVQEVVRDVVGRDAFDAMVAAEAADPVSDAELFE